MIIFLPKLFRRFTTGFINILTILYSIKVTETDTASVSKENLNKLKNKLKDGIFEIEDGFFLTQCYISHAQLRKDGVFEIQTY